MRMIYEDGDWEFWIEFRSKGAYLHTVSKRFSKSAWATALVTIREIRDAFGGSLYTYTPTTVSAKLACRAGFVLTGAQIEWQGHQVPEWILTSEAS